MSKEWLQNLRDIFDSIHETLDEEELPTDVRFTLMNMAETLSNTIQEN